MTAWEVLWRCGISELPVDLGQVCRRLGLGLYSYTQGYELLRRYNLAKHVHGADGFLFREEDGPLAAIFYRPEQSQGRRCFTIAHEIGHFALGHCPAGGNTVRRSEADKDSPRARGRPIRLPAPGPLLRPAGPGPAHPLCHRAEMPPESPRRRGVRLPHGAAAGAGRPVHGGARPLLLLPLPLGVEDLSAV